MKLIFKIVGYIIWIISGILMFLFWISWLVKCLGFFGALLGIFFAPGLVIFPLIFWFVEGVFPISYFIIWGIGLVGAIIAGLASIGD